MRAKALLGALVAALSGLAAGQAQAATDQLEPTIAVYANAAAPAQSQTTLVAGRTYTIIVQNYYSEKIPTSDGGTFTYYYDAVYCFEGSTATSVCSTSTPRVFDGGGLRARIGATGTFAPFYRALGSDTGVPAFKPGHIYSHTFTPGTSGRLQLSIARDLRDSYEGNIAVTLYGPPSPGSTGPEQTPSPDLNDLLNGECQQGLGGSPIFAIPPPRIPRLQAHAAATAAAPRFCPNRLQRVSTWDRPAAIADLAPGAEATFLGPLLSPTQKQVSVTLSTSTGDVAVMLTEDDARYRRTARRACFYLGRALTATDLVQSKLANGFDSNVSAGAFADLAGLASYLLPCLKMVDDALASQQRSGASARAAARACHGVVFPIKVRASPNLGSVRVTTRRSYPTANVLRVTCRANARGAVVRVKARRSGVPLRRIVGKRLSVGLVRSPTARGTARGTIRFAR